KTCTCADTCTRLYLSISHSAWAAGAAMAMRKARTSGLFMRVSLRVRLDRTQGAFAEALRCVTRMAARHGRSCATLISMGRFLLAVLATALAAAIPAHAADPSKTLRVAFEQAETTFDPAQSQDTYSNQVLDNILDPMLTYDYLARPAKLVPNTLQALPEISA